MEQIMIRVPSKLKDKLKEESKNLGISLNAYILNILWNI